MAPRRLLFGRKNCDADQNPAAWTHVRDGTACASGGAELTCLAGVCGGCRESSHCDDGDPCTVGLCQDDGHCVFERDEECCSDPGHCFDRLVGRCRSPGPGECIHQETGLCCLSGVGDCDCDRAEIQG